MRQASAPAQEWATTTAFADAEPVQRIDDRTGLVVEPSGVPAGAALGKAVARAVNQQHAAELVEPLAEGRPPAQRRAGRAMQEDHGKAAVIGAAVDHMQ